MWLSIMGGEEGPGLDGALDVSSRVDVVWLVFRISSQLGIIRQITRKASLLPAKLNKLPIAFTHSFLTVTHITLEQRRYSSALIQRCVSRRRSEPCQSLLQH